jgi:malate permease and related proteins
VSFASVAVVIGKLLALVAVGAALRASRLLHAEDARVLNAVIIYVGLPALIFQAVHPAQLSWLLAEVAAIAWAVALAGFALGWIAARLLKLPPPAAGALMLTAALGNTGYIGYPLALGMLGESGLVRAVFYDVFGTVGVLLTLGLALAARLGEAEERPRLIRELLTFPAVLAVGAALLLRPVTVPIPVSEWLDALAKLVVPLIMISLGLSFQPRAVGAQLRPVAAAAAIKLVLLPLLALAVGTAVFKADADAVRLVVLQAGVPSMMLSLVFGARFRLDTELIASVLVVTTAVAIVTIPLMQVLVR